MAFKTRFETAEAEAARLAQAPEGSTNHALSSMPVTIHGNIQDLLIEVPSFAGDPKHAIVVVPFESHGYGPQGDSSLPWKRYNRSWDCIVVASDHPSYPVGGYRISMPEYQLRRGTQRTLRSAIEEALAQPMTIESAIRAGLLGTPELAAAAADPQ